MRGRRGKLYQRLGSYITALILAIGGTSAVWSVLFSQKAGAYSSDARYLQVSPETAYIELGTSAAFDVYATYHDDATNSPIELGNLAGSLTANVTSGKVANTLSGCDVIDWSTATSSSTAVISGNSDAIAKFCYKPSAIGDFNIDFTGSFPYNWLLVYGVRIPEPKSVSVSVNDVIPPVAPNGGVVTITDGNDVLFTWNPIDDNGTPVYYVIQIDGGVESGLAVGANTMVMNDMANGNHVWHVKSVDGNGHESAYSDQWAFKIDIAAPQITLNGNPIENVEVGNAYIDAGATAIDDIDGDLTDEIVVSGANIDTSFVGGPYTVQYKVSDSNDNDGYAYRTVNVVPRKITVSVDGKTKVYGEVDAELTYQIASGSLLPGDNLADLGIVLIRDAGEDVASYEISRQSSVLNPDYDINFDYTNAFYDITKRPITITADAKSKVYGEVDPALTYTINPGGLVAGDSVTGELARASGEHKGDYSINQGTLAISDNYEITVTSGLFSITKASITVTADAITKVFGAVDPALTYQITSGALVSGDVFTGSPLRVAGETVGSYAINRGTLTLSDDYDISFIDGTFTITAAPSPVLVISEPTITDGTTIIETPIAEEEVVGDIDGTEGSTDSKPETGVKSATTKKEVKSGWNIFGVAWYWWLLLVAAAAFIWWMLFAKPRSDDDTKK